MKINGSELSLTVQKELEIVRDLRQILVNGYDNEGRKVSDGALMLQCITNAEAKLGKALADLCLHITKQDKNGSE